MNRKIFSQKIIKSLAGIIAAISVPGMFGNSLNGKQNINVKINPDAVSRKKTGGSDVRTR